MEAVPCGVGIRIGLWSILTTPHTGLFHSIWHSKVGASLCPAWGLPTPVGWAGKREGFSRWRPLLGHNGRAVRSTTSPSSTTSPREDAVNDKFWVFLASFEQRRRRHQPRHPDDVAAPSSTSTGSTTVEFDSSLVLGSAPWVSWESYDDFLLHLPHLRQGHKVSRF